MSKLSTIEIAAKQRHMLLLGKVKENKALTRAELGELKRYERQAAAKIIAKAKVPAKPRAKKKKPKAAPPAGPGKKKAKKKKQIKKKRKARLPIDVAVILKLGLECENRADAAVAIRTRKSLTELLKYPELKQAWDRGRFLRSLRGLAKTTISISDAAKNLGFESGRVLKAMFDEDKEVGELWNETRLGVKIEFDTAMFEEAKGGNPAAIKAVQQNLLLDEKEYSGADLTKITILQLVEITGRTRRTIHDWFVKFGMPRNVDKTFDLSIFMAWFEEFLLKKVAVGKESAVILDPLKAMKAEKLKAELARHRNETLDRNKVIIQLVAWAQHIVAYCNRHNDELSRLCIGQPREKVLEIHRQFFRDLHASIATVPKELRLLDDKGKELVAFLRSLKPEDGGPGRDI